VIPTFASEKATGISSLGLDLKAFLFQLITFVIIMWLLNKFALRKIFATIETRRNEVTESLKAAEEAMKSVVEANNKASKILQDARAKADVIASDAHKEAVEAIKNA
jgi:F-type H+-transporting ATPase subunit b